MKSTQSYNNWFAKYPFLFWALALVAGIGLQHTLQLSFSASLWLGSFSFLLATALATIKFSSWKFYYAETRALLSIATIFLLGILLPHLQGSTTNPYPSWKYLDGELVELTGQIQFKGKSNSGNYRYAMDVDSICFSETSSPIENLRVLLSGKRSFPDLETIKVSARWRSIDSPKTPGLFNYSEFLSKDNIYYTAVLDSVLAVYPTKLTGILAAKKWMKFGIKTLFDQENQGLAEALLLGDKSQLSSEDKQRFAQSGLSHILAVSGLHVGFVVAPFFFLLLSFRNSVWKMTALTVVFSSILVSYVMLTGGSPSVVRAAIMAFLLFVARARFLPSTGLNILGATAFIILSYNNEQIFDIGFQLSFCAVAVILVAGPPINKWLISFTESGIIRWLVLTVVMSFVIQIALSPLLALYFDTLSFSGSFSNLIAMIPAGLLVQIGLPSLILYPLIPWVQPFLHFALNNLAFMIQWAAEMGESISFLQFSSPNISMYFLWYWVLIGFGISVFKYTKMRKTIGLLFILSLIIDIGIGVQYRFQTQKLELTMLDVGQGDAFLLKTPENKHYLIDTGPGFASFSEAKNVIIPYLKYKNIDRINGIFISHWHADHSGGLKHLIDAITIDSVFGPPSNRAIKNEHFRAILENEILFLDGTTPVAFLNPSSFDHPHDENDNSLVMLLKFGDQKFLLMGDAEKSVEEELLRDYSQILDVDVFKVGHHGSRTSSTKSFIDTIKPEVALVSNAWKSRFRHPNPEAIDVIDNHAKVYFTALHGTVTVLTDGATVEVLTSVE